MCASVLSVAVSGDGNIVVSGSADGSIKIWECGFPVALTPRSQRILCKLPIPEDIVIGFIVPTSKHFSKIRNQHLL